MQHKNMDAGLRLLAYAAGSKLLDSCGGLEDAHGFAGGRRDGLLVRVIILTGTLAEHVIASDQTGRLDIANHTFDPSEQDETNEWRTQHASWCLRTGYAV